MLKNRCYAIASPKAGLFNDNRSDIRSSYPDSGCDMGMAEAAPTGAYRALWPPNRADLRTETNERLAENTFARKYI